MLAEVHVLSQANFDQWVADLLGPSDEETALVERGRTLAEVNGCFKCHSIDGSVLDGPTWLGLYGEGVQLEDGSVVVAEDDYIRNSILNPQDQIVAGFTDVSMPATFGRVLTDEDIAAIEAFIESLAVEHDE
jgi:cytochrome c oxidase subunit 2